MRVHSLTMKLKANCFKFASEVKLLVILGFSGFRLFSTDKDICIDLVFLEMEVFR